MGIVDRLIGRESASLAEVRPAGGGAAQELYQQLEAAYGPDRLSEAMSRLELALEDEGWNRLGVQSKFDFSRTGLKKIVELSRSMYLSNPLIKNAVMVQTHYVWGQGVSVTPKADYIRETVIEPFMDNRANRRELVGHQARMLKEIALQTDGNLFFALFTNLSTGAVRVRSVPIDQIDDIVKNPEDDNEPWYYLRIWEEKKLPSTTGSMSGEVTLRRAYYPDWLYRPQTKPAKLGDTEVLWDSPIYHVRTGGTDSMAFGVPEVFAALPWARAVVQLLEDYASIRRAQTRFAWNVKTKGGPAGVAKAKTKLASTLSTDANEANPPATAGATFITTETGAQLEPIKTAGGTPPPDEARRMWLMVSAATGIPETMLSGDATVGNYATAKSLDRPTELEMKDRQELWANIYGDILGYVIDQAATRPNGPLKGKKLKDKYTGEVKVEVLDPEDAKTPLDRRVDITFPNILERDALSWVQAIIGAYTANKPGTSAGLIDGKTATRLLLTALGERDVDETVAAIHPDDPTPPAADDDEPGPALQPDAPIADTQLPTPSGPIDAPTSVD